ncbi:hypothetical protein BST27_12865 [Mycobacterium intermedium]|uniref:Uncharacterized protein n=1 Tax=Mycobacterium intermedium TaxID=28445 RepID=A0A1E3SBU9_MYCIE|nr:hypothetical protein [Mycobacterium intermedium]MCV6967733.1 hypothetical protein [Mycobacterium intermedium]ODQ99122.1 hypothetical protein BHQ20_18710 [Mycobacterium intermedium]OPE50572.1 hypothetical protein BV508_09875 [Mycobacterium intermedium]ORB05518.1 hypothetical protein BST27_12865 [Mycobacterium intermedium]
MTTRGSLLLPESEILSALDFDTEIPCICRKFCDEADHPADWWITLSCGCRYPFCHKALRISRIRLKIRALTCHLCSTHNIAISRVVRT